MNSHLRISGSILFIITVWLFLSCEKDNDIVITDIEGNIYNVVTIGTQEWLVENLKTTRYNDGESIPLITDGTTWEALTTPGYCWYDNDEQLKDTYGAMYNWHTVNTGKLCPIGWHVPSDIEWTKLITYLGGVAREDTIAGGKLKEAGMIHWKYPNKSATNESGFTALPGGIRGYGGMFGNKGNYGSFWSTSEQPLDYTRAYYFGLFYGYQGSSLTITKKFVGLSVRCIKDN